MKCAACTKQGERCKNDAWRLGMCRTHVEQAKPTKAVNAPIKTVAELIEALQQFPPYYTIGIDGCAIDEPRIRRGAFVNLRPITSPTINLMP